MTFTPQVLTKTDTNNSTEILTSSFVGSSTITTGYNTIILTINSDIDSSPSGIQILFSEDGTNFSTFYSDSYISTGTFTNAYTILKKYYKITYTSSGSPSTLEITSRLSTDLSSNINKNTSISVFTNSVENTIDAFGRLRVSEPNTILDIRFPGEASGETDFLKNNLAITSSSNGTYTGTYSNSKLIISATGAGYYISQSRNYGIYQPGKSFLLMASGILYPGDDDYTTRIGYYDNVYPLAIANQLVVRNGLYFEHSGGDYYIKISNNSSETQSFIQSNWNIDKMDGTGPSGLTLDFTKTQLFVIDLEWLGIGRIRFGFYAYGNIQYCHQITNINILTSITAPYTYKISLPICYSIFSTNVSANSCDNFTQICSTLISEGGFNPRGNVFSVSNDSTSITMPSNTETPIIFLRGGGSNYYHQNIIPTNLSMISTDTNDLVLYKLVIFRDGDSLTSSGTITPTWLSVNSNSVCQYAVAFTGGGIYSSANGIVLNQGYFYGRGTNTIQALDQVFNSLVLALNANVENVSDILVLQATFITGGGGSASVLGTLAWQEIY